MKRSMLSMQCETARLVGRVWRPEKRGPSVVIVRKETLLDVTESVATVSDFLDEDPAAS